jgi:hypothetical protein
VEEKIKRSGQCWLLFLGPMIKDIIERVSRPSLSFYTLVSSCASFLFMPTSFLLKKREKKNYVGFEFLIGLPLNGLISKVLK